MLEELRIQNFAIIEDLALRFAPGLNVITGETGAGKSIIIDAMALLLGDRADPGMVRAGAERALVEGVFLLPPFAQPQIARLLAEEQLPNDDPGALMLGREIRSNGRSAARVNGVTVRLDLLRAAGDLLVDIHGQSEHLSLLRPREHLYLLDRYANLEEPRVALAALVARLRRLREEIAALMRDEAELARRADMLAFQVEEITALNLRPEEEDELREERNRLVNSEKLAELAGDAFALLLGSETDSGGVDLLQQAAVAIKKLAEIDPTMAEAFQLAEGLSAQADDLGATMRHYRESVEYSPSRLDELEERLEAIKRVKRKYGGTIQAALDHAARAAAELDTLQHSEERLAELREKEEAMLRQVGDLAGRLSRARQQAADRLARSIERELNDLRMAGGRFEVSIEHVDDPEGAFVEGQRLAFDSTGVDRVEFLMSANPGEPLRPLAKVASGGEAARIMLALKGVLGRVDQTPTLIFDEIDQGIGGRIGTVVGEKLWGLTGSHQVFVVTHLAQLAGFADTHFRIRKAQQGGRTITMADLLDDKGRVTELAEMLGAQTDSGHQSAHDILMLARRVKEGQGA